MVDDRFLFSGRQVAGRHARNEQLAQRVGVQLDRDSAEDRRKATVVGEKVQAFGSDARLGEGETESSPHLDAGIDESVLGQVEQVCGDSVVIGRHAVIQPRNGRGIRRRQRVQQFELQASVEACSGCSLIRRSHG